jgi:hypothetical protein
VWTLEKGVEETEEKVEVGCPDNVKGPHMPCCCVSNNEVRVNGRPSSLNPADRPLERLVAGLEQGGVFREKIKKRGQDCGRETLVKERPRLWPSY